MTVVCSANELAEAMAVWLALRSAEVVRLALELAEVMVVQLAPRSAEATVVRLKQMLR